MSALKDIAIKIALEKVVQAGYVKLMTIKRGKLNDLALKMPLASDEKLKELRDKYHIVDSLNLDKATLEEISNIFGYHAIAQIEIEMRKVFPSNGLFEK